MGSFCVLLILGMSGCATLSIDPITGFTPNEQEGVVFGQMQLMTDGNLIRYYGDIGLLGINSPQSILTYICAYSDPKSVKYGLPLGERAFKTLIADEGYFSAKLPVGRYYIKMFVYCVPITWHFPQGWSTYVPGPGFKQHDPKVIIFDVLPNKATYIGTYIHRSDSDNDPKNTTGRILKLRVVDEYDKCKAVFLAKYPQVGQSAVSRIATFIPYENQKQKAKDVNSADQTKRAQASKAAMDEFSSVASAASITAANITADLREAGNKTTNNAPVSPEAKMREVLRGYKIGVTTYKKCMSDVTAGSWEMNFGGMGMEVLSGRVTLSMAVGIGGRDVCELVFEGDNPQQTGTGKTPNFDKFFLKEITFKP
ncbi:MAG: hypothetical protein WCI77_01785 [Candidatus Omnitrophota bacterium]